MTLLVNKMTIKLPDWLLENIPAIQEPAILSLREDKLVVRYPDNTETIHNTLKEVARMARYKNDISFEEDI